MKMTARDSGGATIRSSLHLLACAVLILVAGAGRAVDAPTGSAPYGTRIPVPGLSGTLVLAGKRPPGAALDAFVAASFSGFSAAAQLAFITLGPMLDLKLIGMYWGTFKRGFFWFLMLGPAVLVLVLSLLSRGIL